jgi:ABC-2 type transport system permease protein
MTASEVSNLRSGLGYWWNSYLMMTRWELTGFRLLLPITMMVQALTGAGFVLGVGLFFNQIPPTAALFVSTGVVVITLITVGLVLGPQLVAQQKTQQTYEFLWSLPVPRSTAALAWLTTNALIAVPGVVAALAVAMIRYDLPLAISPAIVPAALLTLYVGTMLGYAAAHAISNPLLVMMLTQVTIFFILGFSPINFPKEQLPDWLAAANQGLPMLHMAAVTRAALTRGVVSGVGWSYLTLALWGIAATAVAAWAVGRRR